MISVVINVPSFILHSLSIISLLLCSIFSSLCMEKVSANGHEPKAGAKAPTNAINNIYV